ncbi:MAG: hypothetical protein AB1Z98_32875 [Nannocystaceae bacterium]
MDYRLLVFVVGLAGCTTSEDPADTDIGTTAAGSDTSDDGPTAGSTSSISGSSSEGDGSTSPEVPQCTPGTVQTDCEVDGGDYGCVDASCVGSQCVYEPLADGTACDYEFDSGHCHGGSCYYECYTDEDCFDRGPCEVSNCVLSQCIVEPLDGVDAAEADQTDGDCQVVTCVEGSATPVEDAMDPQDDGDACTIDSCVGGMTVHELAPEGTPCDDGGSCDAAGACVAPR